MKNYDLDLPYWGPYNKKYLGAAHIADSMRGCRFDINLFPGYIVFVFMVLSVNKYM